MTIVAQDDDHASHPDDENNGAIQAVMDLLRVVQGAEHTVRRASSVVTLARQLRLDLETRGPPDLLQIVGHGVPGALALGAIWEPDATQRRRLVLDSDPHSYAVLHKWVLPTTSVWLLGCNVGAADRSARVADGPTLLFGLARMWRCPVSAPVLPVDPATDFDDSGIYQRPELLVTAEGLRVTPDPTTIRVPTAARGGTGAPRARGSDEPTKHSPRHIATR